MPDYSYDDAIQELQNRGVDVGAYIKANGAPPSTSDYITPLPGAFNQSSEPAWGGSRLPRNLAAGLGTAFQGVANAPSDIVNSLSPTAKAVLTNAAATGPFGLVAPVNQYLNGDSSPPWLRPSNTNMSQAMGINNPGLADMAVQGIGQAMPFALAGGASVAGQMAAGGAYGLSQSPNSPFLSGALGAAGGIAGPATNNLLDYAKAFLGGAVGKYADTQAALQSIGKLYSSKLGTDIPNPTGITASQAHDATTNLANKYGDTLPFDSSGLQQKIDSRIANLDQDSSVHSINKDDNDSAIEALLKMKNDASGFNNLGDALGYAQTLNAKYKNKNLLSPKPPLDAVKSVRGDLENSIDDNIQNLYPEGQQVGDLRNLANALTQQQVRQQAFGNVASNKNLDLPGFLSKYNSLQNKGQDSALFSPQDQAFIQSIKNNYIDLKTNPTPKIIRAVTDPLAKFMSKSSALTNYLRSPSSPGLIPQTINSATIPLSAGIGNAAGSLINGNQ